MQKLFITIIAVLYLALSSGVTVHMHYCMDKLIGSTLWHDHDDDHKCSECGMTKKSNNGCCKDIHKLVKSDDKHSPAFLSFSLGHAPVAILPASWNIVAEPLHFRNVVVAPNANAPPGKLVKTSPIYIQVCSLLV
jgi:hypothetical protein